ncbi:hypothetical protein [Magnetospirillum molischianum]|nr:hypothetical protein [Magnetospirillum molischianum]
MSAITIRQPDTPVAPPISPEAKARIIKAWHSARTATHDTLPV